MKLKLAVFYPIATFYMIVSIFTHLLWSLCGIYVCLVEVLDHFMRRWDFNAHDVKVGSCANDPRLVSYSQVWYDNMIGFKK